MEEIAINLRIDIQPSPVPSGTRALLRAVDGPADNDYEWIFDPEIPDGARQQPGSEPRIVVNTTDLELGPYRVMVRAVPRPGRGGEPIEAEAVMTVAAAAIDRDYVENRLLPRANELVTTLTGRVQDVQLQGRGAADADTQNNLALWQVIRDRTNAIGFNRYRDFVDDVMCEDLDLAPGERPFEVPRLVHPTRSSIVFGVDAYNLLHAATEAFLLLETGVWIPGQPDDVVDGEHARLGQDVTVGDVRNMLQALLVNGLPYLDRIAGALGDAGGNGAPDCLYAPLADLRNRLIFDQGLRHPLMLELIWSYWHEEGMLVQTTNTIALRFQNRRSARGRDPLAHLELNPLRPLNNLLWGYIQEEYRRLSLPRRAHEYSHHYGLDLQGRAVRDMRPADTRSKFLDAFHNLLTMCTAFFKQADDATYDPDPFPLLNALREVHLLLAAGAHNQFGDLPWAARVEMLIQQWLLARPEMDRFLGGRPMVPYEEPWMSTVDAMKSVQGWTDTTVSHFRDLAVFGEQLLLSIRYTDWVGIDLPDPAEAWALYWRPEIQGYIHAYRAATDVDLRTDAAASQPAELRYARPSELLRRRMRQRPALGDGRAAALPEPSGTPATAHKTFRRRRAERE